MRSFLNPALRIVRENFIRTVRHHTFSREEPVCPYYWTPSGSVANIGVNFGDDLLKNVFEHLSKGRYLWNPTSVFQKKVFIGGSVLDMARDGDYVWGAGLRNLGQRFFFKQLNVFAVRGPLTREFLIRRGIECPAVFGDPGILTPRLYPDLKGKSISGQKGIVPHFSEYENIKKLFSSQDDVVVINPCRPSRDVVSDIASCESIASSSLHGIIVAESFGIPAVWWRASENEPIYKYYDYYLSTGRAGIYYNNVKDSFDYLSQQKASLPDFSSMTEGLLDSLESLKATINLCEI